MPNTIKYSITGDTLSLRKGNYYIGVGDVPKGPTSDTGHWNGITPPTSGYTIYENKASNGPSIRVPINSATLIDYAGRLYGGTNISTAPQALNYLNGLSTVVCVNRDYETIVTSGLTLCVDAGFTASYSSSGVTWYDVSLNQYNATLVNGPTFNSSNGGSIVFNGVDNYVITENLLNPTTNPNESVFVWFYPTAAGQIISELGQATINSGWHDSNIEVSSAGIFSFSIWHGSLTNRVVSTAKSFNTWYHIGFTYSGTTFTAYIDGVSIGSTTFTRETATSLYYGLCAIDSTTNMGTGAYGAGRMSNFLFYNRALSATEVLQNYNAQFNRFIPTVNANLVFNLDAANYTAMPVNNSTIAGTGSYAITMTNTNGSMSWNSANGGVFRKSTANTSDLFLGGPNYSSGSQAYTVFMAYKWDGGTAGRLLNANSASPDWLLGLWGDPASRMNIAFNGAFVGSNSTAADTAWHFIWMTDDGLNTTNSTKSYIATSVAPTGTNGTRNASSGFNGLRLYGRYSTATTSSEPVTGDVGFVKVWDGALTLSEIQSLHAFYKTRFGY
jgi:hypothetical protein